MDQARRAGHRRMRTRVGAGSKSCPRPFPVGRGKIFVGRAEETEAQIAEALRLSPRDTMGLQLDDARGHSEATRRPLRSRRSRGFDGRSRPIEISRHHISRWPPPSRSSVGLTRRVPASRPASPSTRPSRSPRRAAWTAMSDDPTYLAQLDPYSKACARPVAGGRRPATRRPASRTDQGCCAVDIMPMPRP